VRIGFGHFFTHSTASPSEAHCHIQKPATSSLVSLNGPPSPADRSPLRCPGSPSPSP
jgi:hypothetical protein